MHIGAFVTAQFFINFDQKDETWQKQNPVAYQKTLQVVKILIWGHFAMSLSILIMMILKATRNFLLAQIIITLATIFAHFYPIVNALYYIRTENDSDHFDKRNNARMWIYIEIVQFTVNTACVILFTVYAYYVKFRVF